MKTQARFSTSHASSVYKSLLDIEASVHGSGIEPRLLHMLKLRASQINGCAYCIDMHWKDARAAGETEQRLYGLDAWHESPYYTEKERAALAWIESMTRLDAGHVPDSVYEELSRHFDEKAIAYLTIAGGMINLWNRVAIAVRQVPGRYEPKRS